MEGILADTNTLGYLFANHLVVVQLLTGKRVYISEFTEIEMRCNPHLTKTERIAVQALLDDCTIIDFGHSIKEAAIKVRLATGMKLVDSIVAATAIQLGLPIVTGDSGFKRLGHLATVYLFDV